MIRTAIYARISQDRAGAGLGVARQIEDCRNLASAKGWTVTEQFTDNDTSAYRGHARPQFESMLEAIERGDFDAVVTYHQDRLTRTPAEFEQFLDACIKAGVTKFDTVSGEMNIGQGDGILVARIMAAVAANQSDSASRRIRRKNDERAAAGLPHGSGQRAYGYESGGMRIRASEAGVIRTCVEKFIAGDSLISICQWLQDQGVKTATGMNDWRTPTLRNLLKSPRIAGLREHRGEVVGEARWPAIITQQQHQQIKARLEASAAGNTRSPRTYLLSGRVYCGLCGGKMVSAPDGGRRRYGCRTGPDFGGCGKQYINSEPLEDLIARAVLARLDSPAVVQASRDAQMADTATAELMAELEGLTAQESELREAYVARLLPMSEWIKARGPIEKSLEAVRHRLARISRSSGLTEYAGHGASLKELWTDDTMTIQRQAAIVRALLDKVVIHPAPSRGPVMNPERVQPIWRV